MALAQAKDCAKLLANAAQRYMLAQDFTLGDRSKAVKKLQTFLRDYGYLATETSLEAFDTDTVDALRTYQEFNGLPITGKLDQDTASFMSRPRCGVPDDTSNLPALNFVLTGQRWNRTNLTFRFNTFTADLSQQDTQNAFIQALTLWSQVTPLTFAQVNAGNADILVDFVTAAPGDGPGNRLARATWNANPADNIITDSWIRFDDAEQWTIALPPATVTDLVTTAAHEIGHCLGLAHSGVATAIMRSTFLIGSTQQFLDQDDIIGIQSIYGQRGGWFGQRSFGGAAKELSIGSNSDGRLELFYVGTDANLYHNWQTTPNGGWLGQRPFGGAAKKIAIGSNSNGRLELFYIGTDNNLYHNWQTTPNGGWIGQRSFGGAAKELAIGSNGDGRLELFYIGTDNNLYHNWQTTPNGGWLGQRSFGGAAKELAIGSNGDGRLELFYIGTDNNLYHNWQTTPNGGWFGQRPFGGAAKKIVIGSNSDGRLELFYIGTDNNLYHNWQTTPNGGWFGQRPFGGAAKELAIGLNSDGRLELFYVGTDDNLYHNWQTTPNGGWFGQRSFGGAAKRIAIGSNSDGRLELFYIGTDNNLYHNWQR